jgi:pyruvate/2-oxoglutarate dehydrogenase complex dihydrolipoamide dehydrogenase (E3) component
LGTEVPIFEAIDQNLTTEDRDMSRVLERTLRGRHRDLDRDARERRRRRPGLRQVH